MRADLPAGTVTFVFTDVEGSTKLLDALGAAAYAQALADHRQVLREAFGAHGGVEVDTQGDAFFIAFPTAPGAARAVADAVAGLASGPIRVRVGMHTGTPVLTDEGYVGADVHRAARIAACGHGGQVLVSASTAALLAGEPLRDLGEHRLKDLSAPERIYQLGDGDFPPVKSLGRTNLPVPATPFLGRERELEELADLLGREDARLVTLTGPGGSGKTRLALQAAGVAADAFDAGVWWVPLSAVRDPALVLHGAARALGATGDVAEHIGRRSLLLLFDNFEQVVGAAGDLAQLLERCPRLTIAVTSRETLRLDGEWEYAVDPLRAAEAVALFEARARAARRDFAPDDAVAAICERVDNLPLAIELAAARLKVMTPEALLERLERRLPLLAGGARNAPERQRTLDATIAWSHDLLSSEEQVLFRRLGVFAGGATLEAVEAVCDADLDGLASLVDKSLVRHADDRFWMLETIREYALGRLDASGEGAEGRARHARHYLDLAEEAENRVRAEAFGARGEWLRRLDGEHPNLRAALDFFEEARDPAATRLAASLAVYWWAGNRLDEGRRRLETALRLEPGPTAARAKALAGAGNVAVNLGDVAAAAAFVDEALALYRALDDAQGLADSVWLCGYVAAEAGDWAAAHRLISESVERYEELGDLDLVVWATRSLAWVTIELGDVERGRRLHEQNLDRARAAGNRRAEATLLGVLALLAVERGDASAALPMLRDSTRLLHELQDPLGVAVALVRVAHTLAATRDPAAAATVLGAFEGWREELGARVPWVERMTAETHDGLRSALGEDGLAEALARGRSLAPENAVAFALASLEAPRPAR